MTLVEKAKATVVRTTNGAPLVDSELRERGELALSYFNGEINGPQVAAAMPGGLALTKVTQMMSAALSSCIRRGIIRAEMVK